VSVDRDEARNVGLHLLALLGGESITGSGIGDVEGLICAVAEALGVSPMAVEVDAAQRRGGSARVEILLDPPGAP
jgi:hypothetical protein